MDPLFHSPCFILTKASYSFLRMSVRNNPQLTSHFAIVFYFPLTHFDFCRGKKRWSMFVCLLLLLFLLFISMQTSGMTRSKKTQTPQTMISLPTPTSNQLLIIIIDVLEEAASGTLDPACLLLSLCVTCHLILFSQ